jgi:O-antigen/teichoic acid export membrane protein
LGCIAIAIFMMMADTFHLVLYGALRGRRNLRPEALGLLCGQVLTSGGAIVAALLGVGPLWIVTAYLVGSAWNVGWSSWHVRQLGIHLPRVGLSDFKLLLREAAPFTIAGVAVKIYSYADSLMLEAFHGTAAVGIYAVPYKMTYAFQFIPLAFVAALYPALSAAWAEKRMDEMRRVFLGSLRLMAVIAFPIMAGLSALAPHLVPLAFGKQFLPSVGALQVLPWVLLPIFLDFPIGSLLNASNRASQKTAAMVGTMFLNVLLNALLVPPMGPMGAAIAGVCSFWFLLGIGFVFTAKDAGGWKPLLSILGRGLLAGVIAWIAWDMGGKYMPLFAAICFGAAISILSAFGLKLLTLQDLKWIQSLRKVKPVIESEAEDHADA